MFQQPNDFFANSVTGALDGASRVATPHATLATKEWEEQGNQEWASWFAVTDLAAASIGAASAEVASLTNTVVQNNDAERSSQLPCVDRRLASLWFGWSIQPQGWQLPAPWDALAGDYATADGWIKLHTNAPHHRNAALTTLALPNSETLSRQTVAEAVLGHNKDALEQAIIDAGGCAAAMRSIADWQAHPQGQALNQEALIMWEGSGGQSTSTTSSQSTSMSADCPLSGIRVLDLTRVLAGPVASRFLARFGADVLRVDPPDWEEPGVIPEVTLGKRCTGLDLTKVEDRNRFESLLKDADILLHGYRPGALAGLGYDRTTCLAINPELIDVSLCAYGHSGPWAHRRGFDSLVQMSCGIADWGMQQAQVTKPQPLPVQALDHATGYLMAAAAVRALRVRCEHKTILQAKLSLARTALLLATSQRNQLLNDANEKLQPASQTDLDPWLEQTSWGQAQRLEFPARIGAMKIQWPRSATELRSTNAVWLE